MAENSYIDDIVKAALQDFEPPYNPENWALMTSMLEGESYIVDDIDKIAKDSLAGYDVPFNPIDWALMESALNKMEESEIDDLAKDNLEDYQVAYNQADWTLMNALLDSELSDDIDTVAQSNLSAYEVVYKPTDWLLMSNALDNAGYVDEIDVVAQDALESYEVAYRSADWNMMETQLNEDERVRTHLVILKTIEVCLMLFAIWTFVQFVPFDAPSKLHKVIHTPVEENITKDNIPIEENIHEIPIEKSMDLEESPKATATEGVPIAAFKQKSSDKNNSNTVEDSEQTHLSNVDNSISTQIAESMVEGHLIEHETLVEVPDTKLVKPSAATSRQELHQIVRDGFDNQQSITELDLKGYRVLHLKNAGKINQMLATKSLHLIEKPYGLNLVNIDKKTRPLLKPARIGLALGPNFTNIVTPKTAGPKKEAGVGSSVGMVLDLELTDKWEWSIGFILTNKQFSHRTTTDFTYGINAPERTLNSVTDVQYNVIQIPLQLQYNIKKLYPWRFYAVSGVTSSLIMQVLQRTREVMLTDDIFQSTITRSNFSNDLGDETVTERGIFEGGEILNNTSISTDIGFGVEHLFNPKWGIYFQPTYRHVITPVNNHQDKFHTFSFLVGTRVIL